MSGSHSETLRAREVLIVGAGPAGMAAAVAAARRGASVTVLDSGDQLGGQFWRHLPKSRRGAREEKLHHQWQRFMSLKRQIETHPAITVRFDTQVWSIERDSGDGETQTNAGIKRVLAVHNDPETCAQRSLTFMPDALILATGAHDRTLPFPGWTLPGVYTAGAAQAFAKAERIALGKRVIVAGAGPFLLPVTKSLTQTGAKVVAVCEANRLSNLRAWVTKSPHKLAAAAGKVTELFEYFSTHLRHRIPYRPGTAVIAAHGDHRVESVTVAKLDRNWAPIRGTEKRIAVDAVCVSHGFTARIELAIAAGCAITADRFIEVDRNGRTSVPNVYAAGELTAIGGCDAALAEGEIVGFAAAGGRPDTAEIRASVKRAHRRRATFSLFASRLEAAHGIRPGWIKWLTDDTVLCRCEETKVGEFTRTVAATNSASLRSTKLTTRAGLGICQGRICGRNVEALLPARNSGDATPDERPIAVPVTLGALAQLDEIPADPVEQEET